VFNKSTLFNRNDAQRRDANSVPATSARPAGSASDNSNSNNLAGRTVRSAKEATVPATPVSGTSSSPSSVSASLTPNAVATAGTAGARERESLPAEPETAAGGMGARLIVGPEVKLKGAEILDCDTLVVEGRVEATMDSRVVRIAEGGSFFGKVSIDVAEIHGTFEGELTARSQLIIHSTGRVKGTIRYGKLVADEGGELCGDISVLTSGHAVTAKANAEPVLTFDAAA